MTIFISYDYDNDRHYKNLMVAWSKNASFDIEFYDSSVDVSVNSEAAAPVRRVISQRIRESDILLCIVGEETHTSEWVEWEIDKADELGKKFVAVKTDRTNTTPPGLYGKGAEWAHSFTFDSIKKAIERAHYGFEL